MLRVTVDTDGSQQVHILFERGSLRAFHYNTQPEDLNSHFDINRVDSMAFIILNSSHRTFEFDVQEASSDPFLQVRVRTQNGASMNFKPSGYQHFHVDPGQDKTLIYSRAGGANARVNT